MQIIVPSFPVSAKKIKKRPAHYHKTTQNTFCVMAKVLTVNLISVETLANFDIFRESLSNEFFGFYQKSFLRHNFNTIVLMFCKTWRKKEKGQFRIANTQILIFFRITWSFLILTDHFFKFKFLKKHFLKVHYCIKSSVKPFAKVCNCQ